MKKLLKALLVVAIAGCGVQEAQLGSAEIENTEQGLADAPDSKILNVDWQQQQTGYWCGPASTRIALSARIAPPSQGTLAGVLGTTVDGTSHVGLVANALNRYLGTNIFFTREISDPWSPGQRDQLRRDLVAAITNEYAFVINIVSGWRPSFYPGGTIFHYVAVIGYDQGGNRALIADPAARGGGGWASVPTTYWVNINDLATWISGKGYAANNLPIKGSCRLQGAIAEKYRQINGGAVLGNCLAGEFVAPDNVGRFNQFERGSIYWTEKLGAHAVLGSIRNKWRDLGWERGVLGYPLSDELRAPDQRGAFSVFQGGSIYWTEKTGAHNVQGKIFEKWGQFGWEKGPLGYPVSDEQITPDKTTKFSRFEQGAIYWSEKTGAVAVYGDIYKKWSELEWEKGALGYPTSDETIAGDNAGRFNSFVEGAVYWSSATGAHAIYGEIFKRWVSLGREKGLGYPLSDEYKNAAGEQQSDFQKGSLIFGADGTVRQK